MSDILQWIMTTGDSMGWLAVWLSIATAMIATFGATRAFFKRREKDAETQLAVAKSTIANWEARHGKEKQRANRLQTQLDALKCRLPDLVLEEVIKEQSEGNVERAQRLIEDWLEYESTFVASVVYRAAQWRLAFYSDAETGGFALKEASRFAAVSAGLNPSSQECEALSRECEALISVAASLKHPLGVSDRQWESIHNYVDPNNELKPAFLAQQAERSITHGHYQLALALSHRALVIVQRKAPHDQNAWAGPLSVLGRAYRFLGKYAKALPLFEQALEIRELALGADHPDTATSLSSLAVLHSSQGEYASALPLAKRAFEIRERALGADHPTTANSLNNLASLHRSQGEYATALPLFG